MIIMSLVWTWWIGFYLTFVAIALVAAIGIGYIIKVERLKHPKKK